MLIKMFAGMLIRGLLKAQKEVIQDAAKEQALQELREKARRYFLAHVSKTVADEYVYNSINYVKSLELMEAELEISPQQVRDLTLKFSGTLEQFERDFSQKLPDQISTSEVIKTLSNKDKTILGGMMAEPQSSPSLIYINKLMSPAAESQPLVLQKHQENLVEQKAIELWEELLAQNFSVQS